MKMTKIAAAISFSLVAGTAMAAEPSVDVYGSLRLALTNDDSVGATSSENKFSRFGVKSSVDLGNGLTGLARFEYGLTPEQKAAAGTRLAFIGIKGDFGTVTHGSQGTIYQKYVRGPYFSNASDSLRPFTSRQDGITQYARKGDGYTFMAAVQTEGKDGADIDSYSVGGDFNAGDLKIQAAAVFDNEGEDKGTLFGARAWYSIDAVKLSAFVDMASENFNTKTSNICGGESTTIVGAYASYKTGAHQFHGRVASNDCDDSGDLQSVKGEYVNYLSKNMRVWASVESVDTVRDEGEAKLISELGVRYDF